MNHILPLALLLGLVTSAWAQIDTESIPTYQDQRDLYARAAASRLAILGTVIGTEGVSERVPPEALLDRLNKGTVRGGSLITVQVDEVVCRQSDFDSAAPRSLAAAAHLGWTRRLRGPDVCNSPMGTGQTVRSYLRFTVSAAHRWRFRYRRISGP